MHFTLVDLRPLGMMPSDNFDDLMLSMFHALSNLGFSVETRIGGVSANNVNIIFGAHIVARLNHTIHLPPRSIIVNLERYDADNVWFGKKYLQILNEFSVWDCSPRNITLLREQCGSKASLMRPGYVPEMTRLAAGGRKTGEVLCYGVLDARKMEIIRSLPEVGISVAVLPDAHGRRRDEALVRSKLFLNLPGVTSRLEVERLGYLFANSVAVVSEHPDDMEVYPELAESCVFCRAEELAPAVQSLLADDARRERVGREAFRAFSSIRFADELRKLVGQRTHGAGAQRKAPVPKHLNVGSGKDFRDTALNVDIVPHCQPDLLLDFSLPLQRGAIFQTNRFGEITLESGDFSLISANDVLEHVRDLPQMMSNFLELLCDGGELHIQVPYDLSLGAWQDPTHVRAFNENSWLYYTAWAWYMGWREERFSLKEMSFFFSDYGKSLLEAGMSREELPRMPRAVDGMHVILVKRKSTDREKEEYDVRFRALYEQPTTEWRVQDGRTTEPGSGGEKTR